MQWHHEFHGRRFLVSFIIVFVAFFLAPKQIMADDNAFPSKGGELRKPWESQFRDQRQTQDKEKNRLLAGAGQLEYFTIGNDICFTVQTKAKVNLSDVVEQHPCLDYSSPKGAAQAFDLIPEKNQYRFRLHQEPTLCLGADEKSLQPIDCGDKRSLWKIIRLPSVSGRKTPKYQLINTTTNQCVMEGTRGVGWSMLQMNPCFDISAANLEMQSWKISRNGIPVPDLGLDIPVGDKVLSVRPEPVDAIRKIRKEIGRLMKEDKLTELLLLGKLPELTQLAEAAGAGDTRNINFFVEEYAAILDAFKWYGLYREMEPLVQLLVNIAKQRLPHNREVIVSRATSLCVDDSAATNAYADDKSIDSSAASLYADSLTWLADVNQKLGRPERSVSIMREALALVPKFGVMANNFDPLRYNRLYANALLSAGCIDEAETPIRKSLEEYRKQYQDIYWANKPKAPSYLLLVLQGIDPCEKNKGPRQCRQTLSQTQYANTLEVLGDYYAKKDQLENASEVYSTIIDYFDYGGRSPVIVGRLYLKEAKIQRSLGKLAEAQSLFTKAETILNPLLPPKSYERKLLNAEKAAIAKPFQIARLGIYQVKRDTKLQSEPQENAQVIVELRKGMKLQVVGQSGEYLKVHSRQGKLPGYVLQIDVTFLGEQ